MERLQNQLSLTYLPRGQLTSMRKCVAEPILGNWLEIISTYVEIYSLDDEVIMRAEINELNHFRIGPCEGSKGKQLIELNEYGTLMVKYGMFGRTMTSNEGTVFREYLFVLCA